MTTTKLNDTDAPGIAGALLEGRRAAGSPAMGMVMTLVIVCQEEDAEDSLRMAQEAAREHPSRLLAVVMGNARGKPEINAEIRAGSCTYGEMALIRLGGEVAKQADSFVLPLLLHDSPVVVWWPTCAPSDPAADPIGRLGTRRITDAAEVRTSRTRAMLIQCEAYAPGNTDLAWTRITGWRALLAAALDQYPGKVLSATVVAERISPSADLLSAWLSDRLRVQVTRKNSDGPGITDVVLETKHGQISLVRYDGKLATLHTPGQPDRPVALKRRNLDELLSEELRRLDPDDVYAATARRMVKLADGTAKKTVKKAPAKKATAKKASAR